MVDLYPLFLDLEGRACLVVGAGTVAARKVEGLLAAGARVTVVAPEGVEPLGRLAAAGAVVWVGRRFEPSDLDGMALAFVATSDPEVNREAVRQARARGVWVNAADDPGASDVHVPAVLRRGRVAVAVSTAGASPALAAWLRDRLADAIPPGLEALAEVLAALREITPPGARLSGHAQRELLDSGILEDLAAAEWEEADRKVTRFLGADLRIGELLRRRSTEAT
ncbi:MAG: bifunctional precorrin-2 dehydrogenase/sirohydrochlorin ferrochelatase [Deltaproteobacteria bacterium]|nr:bifunctional precorrin-2 dehydrogenase/sirohydrochlorin ferrochelatase [Deltaproteobacteria bacterium]